MGRGALLQIESLETRVMLSGHETLTAEASTGWVTFGGQTDVSTSATQVIWADHLIAVDPGQEYVFTGEAIAGEDGHIDPGELQSLGLESFDDQLRPIHAENYRQRYGSAQTTLAAPLSATDTAIHLTDATGWAGANGSPFAAHDTGIAWWDAASPYQPYSYSPDAVVGSGTAGVWDSLSGNTLHLSPGTTWGDFAGANVQTLAAGTPVMNTGGEPLVSYSYAADRVSVTDELTAFTSRMTGEGGLDDQFRPSVHYVRPLLVANQLGTTTSSISWQDVRLESPADQADRFDVGETVTLRPTGLSDLENWTVQWTRLDGPDIGTVHPDGSLSLVVPSLLSDTVLRYEVTASKPDPAGGSIQQRDEIAITLTADASEPLITGVDRPPLPSGRYAGGHIVRLEADLIRQGDPSVTYQWEQISGPSIALTHNAALLNRQAWFEVPHWIGEADLSFRVTVSDAQSSVSDVVHIRTQPASIEPFEAVANVGEIAYPGQFVQVDASPLTGATSYEWTQVGGPTVPLYHQFTPSLSLHSPAGLVGDSWLTFEVTARDAGTQRTTRTTVKALGAADPVEATKTVSGQPTAGTPSPPIQLGVDWPTSANFPNATYRWTQVGGPQGTIVNATHAAASFQPTSFAKATYVFELEISDGVSSIRRRVQHTVTPTPEQTRAHIADVFVDVRNTIYFEASKWRLRSGEAVEKTRVGNAWDQAALLAERLTEQGLDTYNGQSLEQIVGRVVKSIDDVNAWLGTEHVDAAFEVLEAARLNPVLSPDGTQLTFDHSWLRVAVPNDDGTTSLIDLDPSFKRLLPSSSLQSLSALTGTDVGDLLATGWQRVQYDENFDSFAPGSAVPNGFLATDETRVEIVDDVLDPRSVGELPPGTSVDRSLKIGVDERVFLDQRDAINGEVNFRVSRLSEGFTVFGRSSTAGEYGLIFINYGSGRMRARLFRRFSNGHYQWLAAVPAASADATFTDQQLTTYNGTPFNWDQLNHGAEFRANGTASADVSFRIEGATVSAEIDLLDPVTGNTVQTLNVSYTDDGGSTTWDNLSSPGRFGFQVQSKFAPGTNGEYLPRVDNVEATLLTVQHDTAADVVLRDNRDIARNPQRRAIDALAAVDVFDVSNGIATPGVSTLNVVSSSVPTNIDARVQIAIVDESGTVLAEQSVGVSELETNQILVKSKLLPAGYSGKQDGWLPQRVAATFYGSSGVALGMSEVYSPGGYAIQTTLLDPDGNTVTGTESRSTYEARQNKPRYTAVVINGGQHSTESLGELRDNHRTATSATIGNVQSVLSHIGGDYFRQVEASRRQLDAIGGYVSPRRGLETAFVSASTSGWLADKTTTYPLKPKNLFIDVPGQSDASISIHGNAAESADDRETRLLIAALTESAVEGRVVSAALSQAAASAASVLGLQDSIGANAIAAGSGTDGHVFHLVATSSGGFDDLRTSGVDFASRADLLAALQLDTATSAAGVEDEIADFLIGVNAAGPVSAGDRQVLVSNVPTATPQPADLRWSGVAYIAIDTVTGTFDSILVGPDGQKLHGGIELPGADAGEPAQLLDTVDSFSGAVRRVDTDFSLTVLGVPIEFSRYYNSGYNELARGWTGANTYRIETGFGIGWRHSYDAYIRSKWGEYAIIRESDGSETRFEWEIDANGNHTFVASASSPTLRMELRASDEKTVNGYTHGVFRVTSIDGTIRKFAASYQYVNAVTPNNTSFLTTIEDVSGNQVNIHRNAVYRSTDYGPTLPSQTAGVGSPTRNIDAISVTNAFGEERIVLDFVPSNLSHFIGNILVYASDDPNVSPHQWIYEHGYVTSTSREDYRVTRVKGPLEDPINNWGYIAETVYAYDRATKGYLIEAEGPSNHRIEYHYGKNNRVEKTIEHIGTAAEPQEAVTLFQYDLYRRATTITRPNGEAVEVRHTASGNVAETISPEGVRATTEYAPFNRQAIASTTGIGATTRYDYDEYNRLVQQVDPTGVTVSTTYEALGFGDPDNAGQSQYGRPVEVRRTLQQGNGQPLSTDAFVTRYAYYIDGLDQLHVTSHADRIVDGSWFYDNNTDYHITYQVLDAIGRPIRRTEPHVIGEDGTSRTTSMSYDASTGLATSTDFGSGSNLERIADHVYDPATGYLSASYSPDVGWIGYQTDAYGRVTAEFHQDTVTGAYDETSNRISRHRYDIKGRLWQTTSFEGSTTTFTYNDAGWKLSETVRNAAGIELATHYWEYNADGTVASITDSVGATRRFVYDSNGQVSQVINPDGGIEAFAYDANGSVTWHRTPGGVETEYDYDAFGRVVGTTASDGSTSTQSYDGWGRLATVTDFRGLAMRYDYDAFDRVVRTRVGIERVEAVDYDPRGAVLSTTVFDVSGLPWADNLQTLGEADLEQFLGSVSPDRIRTASAQYDAAGRPISRTDAVGAQSVTTYDNRGRKLSETDARGAVTSYTYDQNTGRVSSMSRFAADVGTATTSYIYDIAGRVLATVAPDGAVARAEYDDLGRLVASFDPLGNVTRREYDAAGRVIAETDPLGNTTRTEYDELGRVVAVVGAAITMAGGNLVQSPRTSRRYDRDGRVTHEVDPLGRETRYFYDELGRLTFTVGPAVQDYVGTFYHPVTERTYDTLNAGDPNDRATGDLVAETSGLSIALGADPRVTPPDRTFARTVSYQYDLHGRTVSTVGTDPDGIGPAAAPVVSMTYNGFGETMSETSVRGLTTTFVRDAAGRVVSRTVADPDASGPGEAATFSTTYDLAGQVIAETDALGQTTNYSYDGFGRKTQTLLPSVAIGSGLQSARPVQTMLYDIVGRTIAEIDARGQATEFQYDAAGRLIKTILPDPDGAGWLPSTVLTRTYDAAGRVIAETDELGRTKVTEYDEAGRSIKATEIAWGGGSRTTERWLDLAGQVVKEIDTLGRETVHTYDNLGRRTSTTTPDPDDTGPLTAETVSSRFDRAGNLAVEIDARDNWTIHSYDLAGRRTETRVTDSTFAADDLLTAWTYDVAGSVLSETSVLGHTISHQYDAAGRRVRTIDQLGPAQSGNLTQSGGPRITSFAYDRLGRLISTTDAAGNATSQSYDALGRVVSVTSPDPDGAGPLAPLTAYSGYDIAGALIWQRDAAGRETDFTLDNRGRVIRTEGPVVGGVRPTSEVFYNPLGLVAMERELWGTAGSLQWIETTYAYDGFGRRTTTTTPDPDGAGPANAIITTLSYDAADRVVQQTQTDGLEVRTSTTTYDAFDRVVETVGVDPDGAAGSLVGTINRKTYDDDGDLILDAVLHDIVGGDAVWNETRYEHDGFGRLTRTTAPNPLDGTATGPTTEIGYDSAGNVLWTKDALGRVVRNQYDARGQLLATTIPQWLGDVSTGGTVNPVASTDLATRSTYDVLGRVVSTTDANGRTATTSYDALGRVVRITQPDPDGAGPLPAAFVESTYDEAGNVVETVDHLGRRTVRQYDALGRQTAVISPHATDANLDGTPQAPTVATTYDLAGNVLATTDAVGVTTSYEYNVFGAVEREVLPANGSGIVTTLEFEYDSWGNRTLERTSGGGFSFQTLRTYDALGREIEAIGPDPGGSGVTTGAQIGTTDRNGLWSDNEWAPRTKRVYGQDGQLAELHTWRTTRGYAGVETHGFVTETRQYDRLGRLTKTIAPADAHGNIGEIQRTYDAAGQLLAYTDPLGNTTGFAYDAFGNVVAEVDSYGETTHYWYTATGELASRTLRTGEDLYYHYDHLGRVVAETWHDVNGQFVQGSYTIYSDAGQVHGVSTPESETYFAYDRLDRLSATSSFHRGDIALTDANGNLKPFHYDSFAYDNAGRRTLVTRTDADWHQSYEAYSYDALGQVAQITHSGSPGADVTAKTIAYTYDFAGRLLEIDRQGDGLDHITSYAWDGASRLDQVLHQRGSQIASQTFYAQDASGLVIGRHGHTSTLLTHFWHDATGQLIREDHPGTAEDIGYGYDLAGNRTITSGHGENHNPLGTYVYQSGGNRLLRDRWFDYTYDAEGRLATKTARTSGGGVAAGSVSTYDWDHAGRLRSVLTTRPDGSQQRADYDYDGLGRRIGKRVLDRASGTDPWTQSLQQRFAHDGPADSAQVTAVADGSGTTQTRTLLSAEVDRPLAVDPVAGASVGLAGTAVWLLADHQGSVAHALPDSPTQGFAAAVEYTAFGGLLGGSRQGGGLGPLSLYGYTGQLWDASAGLGGMYHYRARWYDAAAGRFASTDPAGLSAGDSNLYRYVSNQPTSATDPSGKFLKKLFKKISGAFGKLFDKLFSEKIQKFVRPALAVLGAVVLPGIGAAIGSAIGAAVGAGLSKAGLGALAAKAGTLSRALVGGAGAPTAGGLAAKTLAAKGSTGWANSLVAGVSGPTATGFVQSAYLTGIGATDPFSQILVGGVTGYRAGGAFRGTAIGDALGGGIAPGVPGALYGAGVAGLAQAGGSLTTLSEVAGGSLGYSIAPGLSVGFSLPAAMAHNQQQRKQQALQRARQLEARRQQRSLQNTPSARRLDPFESVGIPIDPEFLQKNGVILAQVRHDDPTYTVGDAQSNGGSSGVPLGLDRQPVDDSEEILSLGGASGYLDFGIAPDGWYMTMLVTDGPMSGRVFFTSPDGSQRHWSSPWQNNHGLSASEVREAAQRATARESRLSGEQLPAQPSPVETGSGASGGPSLREIERSINPSWGDQFEDWVMGGFEAEIGILGDAENQAVINNDGVAARVNAFRRGVLETAQPMAKAIVNPIDTALGTVAAFKTGWSESASTNVVGQALDGTREVIGAEELGYALVGVDQDGNPIPVEEQLKGYAEATAIVSGSVAGGLAVTRRLVGMPGDESPSARGDTDSSQDLTNQGHTDIPDVTVEGYAMPDAGQSRQYTTTSDTTVQQHVADQLQSTAATNAPTGNWVRPKGWRLPKNGTWEGTPGHSNFKPTNPTELGLKAGDVVPFRNGRPDFSNWSKGNFTSKEALTGVHRSDMPKMIRTIAEQKGWTQRQVKGWLRTQRLSPHHAGGNDFQLIPWDLHGNPRAVPPIQGVRHMGWAHDLRNP